MSKFSKEAYKKSEIGINDNKYFQINRRDLEVESDYDCPYIFDKCDPKNKNTDTDTN